MPEEVRTTNQTTGGQKGVKLERFDLIPVRPLIAVSRLYGFGAEKYAARNWEKGYEWSKSFGALQRHAWAFWGGEDLIQQNEAGDDPTAGMPHMAAVAFHAFALMEWPVTHPELDDRPTAESTVDPRHPKLGDYPCVSNRNQRRYRLYGPCDGGSVYEFEDGERQAWPEGMYP